MSRFGNEKKESQLGMPIGTASGILRKAILFKLVKDLGLDTCYKCGMKIEQVEDLSIEHKVPWLDSENPTDLFFSLDNIAFSHLKCNCNSVRKEYLHIVGEYEPEITAYCCRCKQIKFKTEFNKNRSRWNGLEYECRNCKSKRRKKVLTD